MPHAGRVNVPFFDIKGRVPSRDCWTLTENPAGVQDISRGKPAPLAPPRVAMPLIPHPRLPRKRDTRVPTTRDERISSRYSVCNPRQGFFRKIFAKRALPSNTSQARWRIQRTDDRVRQGKSSLLKANQGKNKNSFLFLGIP
jgi:hypothetical protein